MNKMENSTNNINTVGGRNMKKAIIIFVFLVLILILVKFEMTSEFRVRVLANSDSYIDQSVKEEIAEDIDEYIINNDVTMKNISEHLECIEEVLKEHKVKYSLEITKENFPTKVVNGKLSSGGVYDTLVIKIGSGKGENYFSVLYPEYYGITYEDVKTGKVEYKSFIYETFKSLFSK